MGVDLALDVTTESIGSAQERLGMVEGFDVALEMSGHPAALPEMIDNLNHGGRIAMLGLPSAPIDIDWAKVVTHMITIKGIYGRRDVRDLVRDERDAALRRGIAEGDHLGRHRPLPGRGLGGGVRDGPRRPVRQGRHRLDTVKELACTGRLEHELQRHAGRDPRRRACTRHERQLASPQAAHVRASGREVLNFCANNYLGLADHPRVVAAAKAALDEWGFGMASVRFICGTQTQHTELEARLSQFLGTEATILFSSCFDANGGVFEVLLDDRDAVISDELNHASIIDGIRLCKARRLRYRNRDMADLRRSSRVGGRRPPAPDRHRRRVLDGRLPRARSTRSATWPSATTRW